jgi:cholesterol oxidase
LVVPFPALELVRAGAKVILLERGPWRDTPAVREAAIPDRAAWPQGWRFPTHIARRIHHRWLPRQGLPLHRHGLMEMFFGEGVNVACASGVGGTSHAYGGLHALPLRRDYWDGVADHLDSETLTPHYQAVRQQLSSRPAPEASSQPNRMDAVPGFVALDREQEPTWGYRPDTDFSREGSFGSVSGNKIALDAVCVIPAMQQGLRVLANHEALQIRQCEQQRFEVTVRDHDQGRTRQIEAPRVIVAAGAINTVALLLRSRADGALRGLPALGMGFSTNADVMAYWPINTPQADYPAIGVYQRLFHHRDDAQEPLFMQAGISGLDAMPLPEKLKQRLRRDQFIAAMGMDNADGTITLENGRLRIRYSSQQSAVFQRIDQHFHAIAEATGRRPRAPATPTTVHPLGGARVGRTLHDSVVNHAGEVHDIPGLYITDASALPSALGSPPSLSIGAWARHVAHGMIKPCGAVIHPNRFRLHIRESNACHFA